MTLTARILSDYGRKVIAARDQRGTWRPAATAQRRLVDETGATPERAELLVRATAAVADQIKRTAAGR